MKARVTQAEGAYKNKCNPSDCSVTQAWGGVTQVDYAWFYKMGNAPLTWVTHFITGVTLHLLVLLCSTHSERKINP